MKRFIYITLFSVLILSSCSSSQKVIVNGKPGTEIYTPDMRKITTISNDGVATIAMNKDNTYHFLLSRENGNSKFVPFGLNFEKKSSAGVKLGKGTGLYIAGAGVFAELMAIIFVLTGEEELSLTWLLAGLGGVSVGAPMVSFFGFRADYDQNLYRYKYLPEQTTNQDIVFTPLKQTADYKTLDKKTERRKFNSGGSQNSKDPMSSIIGTYSGNGELLDGSDVIEKYSDIKIVIKKKDKNTVIIEVLASDGYSYFDEEILCSVTKQDNQYVLKQKGANSHIVIKNGSLSYTNHNINDGDMIYTLKITAEK